LLQAPVGARQGRSGGHDWGIREVPGNGDGSLFSISYVQGFSENGWLQASPFDNDKEDRINFVWISFE
jgi:hypothetical protein